MTTKAIIGRHIRKQRNTKRPPLSINKLAILAEVDSGQLSRAERGLSGLSLDALQRIADVLNISLGSLLDADKVEIKTTVTESKPSYEINECAQLISKLTQIIWTQVSQKEFTYSRAEKDLIQHQIRTAIEQGLQRGKIIAEYEINAIREKLTHKSDTK